MGLGHYVDVWEVRRGSGTRVVAMVGAEGVWGCWNFSGIELWQNGEGELMAEQPGGERGCGVGAFAEEGEGFNSTWRGRGHGRANVQTCAWLALVVGTVGGCRDVGPGCQQEREEREPERGWACSGGRVQVS